jgi:hypothetical protein
MGPPDVTQGSFCTTSGGHTASNSGFAIGHDASPFKTSISMLIPRFSPARKALVTRLGEDPGQPHQPLFQIQVFNTDGTFYKGCR